MLELLVEASTGVYPLSYGPVMHLLSRDGSRLRDRVLPSRGTHTSFAISSFATMYKCTYNMQHKTYTPRSIYNRSSIGVGFFL